MIRDAISISYAVILAFVLGVWSAVWATADLPFYSELQVNGWRAHPSVGGDNPDPYSTAFLARSGRFQLAAAEGLQFISREDSDGEALDGACIYRISGNTPLTRLWTLQVVRDGVPIDSAALGIPVSTHSQALVRDRDGFFGIVISPTPRPGNWIYPGPNGPFRLILTLYDTAIASSRGLSEIVMPTVERVDCDSG
ncbi:DUF1214 domain-containing protein [Oricola cellulosilytica]|uniref:DUF1214 domain-containing protein n=1 Tax=Oricola cellulosilytica TaxID=1429082 RepID=A0A4R0PAP2_9HYPH|nr:DUF1214 domain-containing protein [Oricola cellulosilytica]TCD14106.1 DUF1214 domain-containing protein [Oricola cellulosilytica]